MSIDRQRVSAVETLVAMGYTWHEGKWNAPAVTSPSSAMLSVPASGATSGAITLGGPPTLKLSYYANDAWGNVGASLNQLRWAFQGAYGRAPTQLTVPDWTTFVDALARARSFPAMTLANLQNIYIHKSFTVEGIRLVAEQP